MTTQNQADSLHSIDSVLAHLMGMYRNNELSPEQALAVHAIADERNIDIDLLLLDIDLSSTLCNTSPNDEEYATAYEDICELKLDYIYRILKGVV